MDRKSIRHVSDTHCKLGRQDLALTQVLGGEGRLLREYVKRKRIPHSAFPSEKCHDTEACQMFEDLWLLHP